MKNILATTAIALVMANGAFAQAATEPATDGTITDTTTSTDTMTPPADGTAATDGTMAPTDGTAATDGTMAPTDGTAATDDTMAPTDGTAATDDTMAPADGTAATDDTMAPADGTATDGMAMDSASSAPAMTMDGYDTVMNADVTTDELTGTAVYGPDDEKVGDIGNLVMGTDGTISDVIVDVGGFLGLGEKPVAIGYDSVQIMKQTDGDDMRAYVSMTEDQLKELPQYEAPADAAAMDAAPADGTATDAAPADAGTAPASN